MCDSLLLRYKVHPRTGHKGSEREWRSSCTCALTSVLGGVGDQLHAPAALLPGKGPGTHCIRGWVGPMSGMNGCGKSRPHWYSIPGSSSPVALLRYMLSNLQVCKKMWEEPNMSVLLKISMSV
jgi:hypothetical protein